MQTDLLSLSKIFTENLFRIPDYQRGYSWGERQLKDFWADLMLLDEGKDHYTGVLTLESVPPEQVKAWTDDTWIVEAKRFKPYYVVDGQQRLTTALILVQAIVERLRKDEQLNYTSKEDIRRKFLFESKDKGVSRSYIFGYEKDNPSYEFLKTAIFKEQSEKHSTGEDTIYTHNLSFAKKFFVDHTKPLSLGDLQSVFTKLTQHFLFNIYTISGDIDVFVAFETMNNRGKPLSHLELLKNRLIFLSTRLRIDAADRHRLRALVNESWKTIYHYLGRNRDNPLDDDRFLFWHFVLYFGHEFGDAEDRVGPRAIFRDRDAYKEYLLNSVFTVKPIGEKAKPLTLEVISDYARDIKEKVERYYHLFNPTKHTFAEDEALNLIRLSRMHWHESLPLLLAVPAGDPSAGRLLRALERVVFLDSFQGYGPRGQVGLVEAALAIKSGKENLTSTIAKLESWGSSITLAESSLLSGDFAESRGYYRWRALRYFLFEYEQSLKAKSRSSRDKLSWDAFVSEDFENDFITVEHIFPQRAKDEYWEKHFKALSQRQRRAIRNSLGNLLALSQPKNSSLGNRPFPEKRDGVNGSAGYRMGCYSEIEVAEASDWTPMEVLRRGMRMLDFLEKRWDVRLGDAAAKTRMLGLEFLVPRPTQTSIAP